jgi:hypothetical protein
VSPPEVTRPSRLVYTQVFEPMAHLGAAVDGAIATGMEGGMRETLDQLDALVVSLS